MSCSVTRELAALCAGVMCLTRTAADVHDVLTQSQSAMPPKFDDCSSGGLVLKVRVCVVIAPFPLFPPVCDEIANVSPTHAHDRVTSTSTATTRATRSSPTRCVICLSLLCDVCTCSLCCVSYVLLVHACAHANACVCPTQVISGSSRFDVGFADTKVRVRVCVRCRAVLRM
jgi:hypothetical protein